MVGQRTFIAERSTLNLLVSNQRHHSLFDLPLPVDNLMLPIVNGLNLRTKSFDGFVRVLRRRLGNPCSQRFLSLD